MRQKFLKRDKHDTLLLFFAGYAQDEKPFSYFKEAGDKDVMLICDYEDETFDVKPVKEYQRLVVIAWSMGVSMAASILNKYALVPKVKDAVAINGTIEGIDDNLGISPLMWEATKKALTPKSVEKFYLRMCGSREAFLDYREHAPLRTIDSLLSELEFLGNTCHREKSFRNFFTKAYIGESDRIFPPLSQQRSWEEKEGVLVHTYKGAHYDESLFKEILNAQ